MDGGRIQKNQGKAIKWKHQHQKIQSLDIRRMIRHLPYLYGTIYRYQQVYAQQPMVEQPQAVQQPQQNQENTNVEIDFAPMFLILYFFYE